MEEDRPGEEPEAEVKTDKFVFAMMADGTWAISWVMKARRVKNGPKEFYVHY